MDFRGSVLVNIGCFFEYFCCISYEGKITTGKISKYFGKYFGRYFGRYFGYLISANVLNSVRLGKQIINLQQEIKLARIGTIRIKHIK